MANSARRSINYTPRMSEWEAYDQLPLQVKRCLQEAVTDYSSYQVYRYVKKNGIRSTIAWIQSGDVGWMLAKRQPAPGQKAVCNSTYLHCKVEPLRTYGIVPNDPRFTNLPREA